MTNLSGFFYLKILPFLLVFKECSILAILNNSNNTFGNFQKNLETKFKYHYDSNLVRTLIIQISVHLAKNGMPTLEWNCKNVFLPRLEHIYLKKGTFIAHCEKKRKENMN